MLDQQNPHVYAPISVLVEEPSASGPGQRIVLEDGTSFCLPRGGYADFKKLQEGDMVLMDLQDFRDGKKSARYASIFVYRRRDAGIPGANEVTCFVIGANYVIAISGE